MKANMLTSECQVLERGRASIQKHEHALMSTGNKGISLKGAGRSSVSFRAGS